MDDPLDVIRSTENPKSTPMGILNLIRLDTL